MNYLLTLCIPTNGVIEWVVPVLDSIYCQKADDTLFQIIVTDNGDNKDFKTEMFKYEKQHNNFIYSKTSSKGFLNQIESFKLAEGKLIKFLNHRMIMLPGSINFLFQYAKSHNEDTTVYFSNGILGKHQLFTENSFDKFVRDLSYWSSWSAGLAFWKKDLLKIQKISKFNELFPHIDILFMNRDSKNYEIVNCKLLNELPTDNIKKGRYNLFFAFADVYPAVLQELVNSQDISLDTYHVIKKELERYISDLYGQFVVQKKSCSYDLTNYERYISKNFSINRVRKLSRIILLEKRIKSMIRRIVHK